MLLPLLLVASVPQDPPAEKLPLSVLHAGNPGTPYSAAWQEFLAAHTTRARFVAGSALKKEDLAGFDVLVIDGEVATHDDKGEVRLKSEKIRLTLDDLQGFPVVLVGGQGGFVSDELHLKTSWHSG